ncbi:hypothetical protein [Methylobacterium sp. CM6247]
MTRMLLLAAMAFACAISVAFAQVAMPSPTVLPTQWGDTADGLFKVALEALTPSRRLL